MKYTKESLGRPATFLLPSLKLRSERWNNKPVEQAVREYLLANFGGYTAHAGNVFGEWTEPRTGKVFYGEHLAYSVAFKGKERIPELEEFLATVANVINEESVYLETGEDAWLIYPEKEGST